MLVKITQATLVLARAWILTLVVTTGVTSAMIRVSKRTLAAITKEILVTDPATIRTLVVTTRLTEATTCVTMDRTTAVAKLQVVLPRVAAEEEAAAAEAAEAEAANLIKHPQHLHHFVHIIDFICQKNLHTPLDGCPGAYAPPRSVNDPKKKASPNG